MSEDLRPMQVACTRKELSCIISNLISEVKEICDVCGSLKDGDLVIGGSIAGTDDHVYIKVNESGFEYYGPRDILNCVRKARCAAHGAVGSPKEDGGAAK